MKEIDQFIKQHLNLQPGDIFIIETPFEDAKEQDFFPFDNTEDFEPSHTAMWINGDKGLAHALQEGYRLPGLRATSIPDCRALVFRFNNPELATKASEILKTWALAKQIFNKEKYLEQYPKQYWPERHDKDMIKT